MNEQNSAAKYLDSWQFTTQTGSSLKVAKTDTEIVRYYESGESLIRLRGGDLYKSLGGKEISHNGTGNTSVALKLDLGVLKLKQSKYLFASYCKVADPLKPWLALWAVNSPIIAGKRISPKSHPADGLLDIIEFSMTLREFQKAYKRFKSGDHIPHPDIKTSKKSEYRINLNKKQRIVVDGKTVAYAKDLSIELIPHAIAVVLL